MRIAYICADHGVPVFDWKKGCSIHVQEIVRALTQLGHSVDLYATNIGGVVSEDLKGLKIIELPSFDRSLNRAEREIAQLRNNQGIRAALTKGGPYDLVYERYSLWSFAAMEYAADYGIPGALEVNSPLIKEQAQFRGLVNWVSAKQVAERCFASASSVFAVSDAVADYLEQEFEVSENVSILPNGVDADRFIDVCLDRNQHTGRFTVGFVGSLKPWHGVDALVEAFATVHRQAPNSRLLIVGDGPERPSIEKQIAKLNLNGATTLTGSVNPAEVTRLLGEMDVGVAPYPKIRKNYFSPMKVFEYMAAGLPVVVTSAGQLGHIIRDECNGLLCEPGDIGALSEALFCLMRDPALRTRLGRRARRDIEDEHTWQDVASRALAFSAIKVRNTNHEGRRVAP